MRAIKFKGKSIYGGTWIYGDLVRDEKNSSIRYLVNNRKIEYVEITVIPETVGQFTGLTDKNGTEIFEGDTIKGGIRLMSVIFKQEACQFWLIWKDIDLEGREVNRYEPLTASYGDDNYCFSNDGLEVIGNIHDN